MMTATTTSTSPARRQQQLPAGFLFPTFAAFRDAWRDLRAEKREELRRVYRPGVGYSSDGWRRKIATGYRFITPRAQNLYALGVEDLCLIYPADGWEWDGTLHQLVSFIDAAKARGAISVGIEQGFDGSDYLSRDFDYDPWIDCVSLQIWGAPATDNS